MEILGISAISQLNVIGRTLARIDTAKQPKSFCELFEKTILEDKEGIFTIFVSANGYDDFIELMEKVKTQKIACCWYYPIQYYEKPSAPVGLEKMVHFLVVE